MFKKTCAYLIFLLLLAACGDGGSTSPNNEGSPTTGGTTGSAGAAANALKGLWVMPCSGAGASYVSMSLQFDGNTSFTASVTEYSDSTCHTPLAMIQQNGTISASAGDASGIIDVPSKAILLQGSLTQSSLIGTAYSSESSTLLGALCQGVSFPVNQATSLAGLTCSEGVELANQGTFNNIFAISGNTLYVGSKSSFLGIPLASSGFVSLDTTAFIQGGSTSTSAPMLSSLSLNSASGSGSCQGPFTLTLKDTLGSPFAVTSQASFSIVTEGAAVYASAGCGSTAVSSLTLPSGSSAVTFYVSTSAPSYTVSLTLNQLPTLNVGFGASGSGSAPH